MLKHTRLGIIFSPFSSISRRLLLSQPNVEINTKRFYCRQPSSLPIPTYGIPQDFKGFLEWYFSKSFETVPYTNRTRRILHPRDIERSVGEIHFKDFKEKFNNCFLPPSHPDFVRVKMVFNNIVSALQRDLKKMGNAMSSYNSIVERIWMSLLRRVPAASTSHLDGLDWEILVANCRGPPYIGESYPGGKIFVSHDLVKQVVGSDIEIATIVSHEVAHIVARHHGERLSKMMRVTTLSLSLSKNFTKHFGERIISLMTRLPFNRRFEMEADYIGLLLLASAGYDPQQVPEVYEKMGKFDNFDNGYKLGGYLRSHPMGRERAKALAQAKIMEEALAIYNEVRAGHGVSERVLGRKCC